MAPHVEKYKPITTLGDGSSGAWVALPETYHQTNADSQGIQKAHKLIATNPKKFREVADQLGPVCDEMQAPQSERNPLVDGAD